VFDFLIGGIECRLIRSVMTNWRFGNFFLLHILQGHHHKIKKIYLLCSLMISGKTLIGKSQFTHIFAASSDMTEPHQLRVMTKCGRIPDLF
jgi:hypothetical protein